MLRVSLTALVLAGVASAGVSQPVGTKIEVVVEPLRGLALCGSSSGVLQVLDPQPESFVDFALSAREVGAASVLVLAFVDAHVVAKLTVVSSIVEANRAPAADGPRQTAELDASSRTTPDLAVHILENGKALTFMLQSKDGSLHFKKFGPVQLASPPQEYFRDLYKDIENLPVDSPDQRKVAKRKLEAKGANLFDQLFPSDLKTLLWDLRKQIKTVQITSDEPWIPWELCRLRGRQDGVVVEGEFFAEAFSITRWLFGPGAPLELTLDNMAIVVPADSGLSQAPQEKSYLLSLASATRKVTDIPASYLDVTDAMTSGRYDAWHFTGHGSADARGNADQSQLELADRTPLTPGDLSGQVENVLTARPFVFFNACQSARAGLSLTGAGGWAKRFVQPSEGAATASVFIGSYWAVFDEAACAFTKELYGRLLAGAPIGEAAQQARLAVRSFEDPTWLAYTVYADPYARLKPG